MIKTFPTSQGTATATLVSPKTNTAKTWEISIGGHVVGTITRPGSSPRMMVRIPASKQGPHEWIGRFEDCVISTALAGLDWVREAPAAPAAVPAAETMSLRAVRVPDTIWQAAQAAAADQGETVSEVIRAALEAYSADWIRRGGRSRYGRAR